MQLRKHFINQVVTDIEVCDKHEIEAFVKSFNLICLKTNFHKFSISKSFKIFLKFEFFFKKKAYLFKSLKINNQNCSLSWPYIWKVSFWDLNAENLVHLTWNDPCVEFGRPCFWAQTVYSKYQNRRRDFCVQNERAVSFPGIIFAGILPRCFGT
jgi:hypothetical protein